MTIYYYSTHGEPLIFQTHFLASGKRGVGTCIFADVPVRYSEFVYANIRRTSNSTSQRSDPIIKFANALIDVLTEFLCSSEDLPSKYLENDVI